MKLLLSSLLLASLCALSSWSVSSPGTPAVTQSHDVSVEEGGTVDMSCCWTPNFDRVRVYWLKNQTAIKDDIINSSNCSNLTVPNVSREDSGRYICNVTVEIPYLAIVVGNGIVIIVTARDETEDNTAGGLLQSPVIIPLAVVAPLLLIALVCFCFLRRRQAQAARVIYEVPHINSEEAEMDKHSTSSSRGSSQWCQVPVYESCDYFERVENKESE
ncbi:uncharacterized protein LOC117747948 isoform X1 [Cyclopterus lumpus]|uniref:uncharacterized protein LOC117747948 isoform X1 n=1 Tax=Cyclopterus lumpus TaxID=8103 RepID=UPI0014863C9D|nr:uncharacterized protein LOC117747948 isoform X1 [Cyclopterus lumpus]